MKTILEDEYLTMNFDNSKGLMETIWKTSRTLDSDTWKNVMLNYLAELEKYKPNKLIIDSRHSLYIASQEDQDWMHKNIYPQATEAGVERIALLVGESLYTQISMEQLVEDSDNIEIVKNKVQQKFFDDYDKSIEWLFDDWF